MSLWLKPGEKATIIGHVFGTPLVVKGWTWLPLFEVLGWAFTTWLAGRRCPERSLAARLGVGAVTMPILVGSEWAHNFAHALAARLVGKPMDALRIAWGTPLVVYFDPVEQSVTPRQHVLRALGGPVFNWLALALALLLRRNAPAGSLQREALDVAAGMNAFLGVAALTPIPVFDGGPILKWSLVGRGMTPKKAESKVRQANGVCAVAMSAAGVVAVKKGRKLASFILAQFALLALISAVGGFKEIQGAKKGKIGIGGTNTIRIDHKTKP